MVVISICKFNIHPFDYSGCSTDCKGYIEFFEVIAGAAVTCERKLLPINDKHVFLRPLDVSGYFERPSAHIR